MRTRLAIFALMLATAATVAQLPAQQPAKQEKQPKATKTYTSAADITAMMAQTGWQRSIARSAEDQTSMGTNISANIGTGATAGRGGGKGGGATGSVSAGAGFESADRGQTAESARANIDILNYDVRSLIADAERASSHSPSPEATFAKTLSERALGQRGMRNRLLEEADSARGTADIEGPVTSVEQSSILSRGRFIDDVSNGPFDGDPAFKERRDQ